MKSESFLDKWYSSYLILISLLVFVVAIWIWLPGYLTSSIPDIADKGVFGDSYGSVNALFTGLAFAGLIFTILLQQREIKLQRQEFHAQLEEMKGARLETERQSKIQEKQLLTDKVQLKMKVLEGEMEILNLLSLQWHEGLRANKMNPEYRALVNKMKDLVESVDQEIT